MKRVFLFVLDSCGCGEAPDAAAFGDAGAHTLQTVMASPYFSCENMKKQGLGAVPGLSAIGADPPPIGCAGRLRELSAGKDTTIGHWELAGLVSEKPLPTFPGGFPPKVLSAFSAAVGRGVLCNKPYSGTRVIADYGEAHLRTGDLIVYTSADSVFQIAAHEAVVPPETLYGYCRAARRLLQGDFGVGRVIARPFAGEAPSFYRTDGRRDFSLEPPGETLLDVLKAAGRTVYAVGKISDIFAGRGVTKSVPTHGNAEGMAAALAAQKEDFTGLCFINLVDFDMRYGHRRDVEGYARAFAEFDAFLPGFLAGMDEGDLLMITADHGCDPAFTKTTDHTREYVPLLVYRKGIAPRPLGTLAGFAHVAAAVSEYLGVPFDCGCPSVLPKGEGA